MKNGVWITLGFFGEYDMLAEHEFGLAQVRAGYRLDDKWKFGAGLVYLARDPFSTKDVAGRDILRPLYEANYKQNTWLSHRVRHELNWHLSDGGSQFDHRLRYRIQSSVKLSKTFF